MTSVAVNELPLVGVVVLNWNGWRDTSVCVASVLGQNYANCIVVVVDNGSTDDSVARLRELHPDVRVIETGSNLGFAGGNNKGIELVLSRGASFVLVLNNDTEVAPDCLLEMVEVAHRTSASVVGGVLMSWSDGRVLFFRNRYPMALLRSTSSTGSERVSGHFCYTFEVSGAAVLLGREMLEARLEHLGYYLDESLFLYCEELELALWCRSRGMRAVTATGATVRHRVGASASDLPDVVRQYYLVRNRIRLFRRHFSPVVAALLSIGFLSSKIVSFLGCRSASPRTLIRASRHGMADHAGPAPTDLHSGSV